MRREKAYWDKKTNELKIDNKTDMKVNYSLAYFMGTFLFILLMFVIGLGLAATIKLLWGFLF